MLTKLQKATISFVMTACLLACLYIHPYGTIWLPLDRFSWNLIFQYFSKICREKVSLKSDKKIRYFTWWSMHTYENISLNPSENEKCFRPNLWRKSKHTFYVQLHFFWQLCHLWNHVEKYGTARQVIDDNILQCLHFVCRIVKTKDTHSEYVILFAFPWQQWFWEHISMLHLYVHCLPYYVT